MSDENEIRVEREPNLAKLIAERDPIFYTLIGEEISVRIDELFRERM